MTPIESSVQHGEADSRARLYRRETAVDEQLRLLSAQAPDAAIDAALHAERDPHRRFAEETLVALCRRAHRAGESDAAWRVAPAIVDRAKGHIARAVRRWRLDRPESVAEETIEAIVSAIYEAVFDLSPRAEFWEARFWVALDRKMLTVLRATRQQIDRTVNVDVSDLDYDDEALDEERGAASQVAAGLARTESLSDPVIGAMVAEALATLPSMQRHVYILKHVACMQESSVRTDGPPTIASLLGVSGRTVRKYLHQAETALGEWRTGGDRSREYER